MPTLQPQETHGCRELIDRLTAPALSGSQQSTDSDEQQRLMSAAGCQPDTPVLYRVHSGMPEHTTRTGFAPERVTSAAPEAVESRAVTSDVSREKSLRISTKNLNELSNRQLCSINAAARYNKLRDTTELP